jgi:ubiquitin carboxyl-terminal hydrolase 7
MDILDERANGGPPMEIDEVVSVRDREFLDAILSSRTNAVSSSPFKDEAFAAKHMPDLGHEVKDFRVYTWRLSNWSKLEKKLTSPDFECGGHKW